MSISGWSVHNLSFSLRGLLKLVRWPNLVIIAFSQYMAAVFLVGPHSKYLHYLYDHQLFLISLSTIVIAAAGYIINDYYDVKIDYINKPQKVVVGNVLKRRMAMFIHTGLNFLGIFMGLLVSLKIAFIDLLAAICLWGYSNQLKRMPLIGNLSVALLSGMAIALVGIHYQTNARTVYAYAFFAFFISLIREIIKDIEDLKGDATFGCKTLPVVWGIRPTKSFIFGLILFFALVLIYLANEMESMRFNYFFAILTVPAVIFIYRLATADTKKHFRQLSAYLKLFMLLGIMSMIVV